MGIPQTTRKFFVMDIQEAWKSLARRPLRSLLSSLGVGIGVIALIAMLSISEGAKQKAVEKIYSLGSNTLRIEADIAKTQDFVPTKTRMLNLSQGLYYSDGKKVSNWLGQNGLVGSYVKKENVAVQVADRTTTATIVGANDNWFEAEKLQLAEGRFFDQQDVNSSKNYCVAGAGIAQKLELKSRDVVRFGNSLSTVIGVLLPKGRLLTEGTGLSALDFDNSIILPISATPYPKIVADRMLVDGIVVQLKSQQEEKIIGIGKQLQSLLLQSHRDVTNFHIVVPVTLLNEVKDSQRIFTLIMGAIAGLSLLVGGIGVMNVMLANVAEQTREIGLRMALGASKRRIVQLYLCNSVLLTLSGGMWGIVCGVIVALTIQHFAGWEIVLSGFSLFIGPFSAIVTGVIFGIHPALRAASFDPALALRDT